MLEHIVSRAATDLSYITRPKDVATEINWTFELGVRGTIDVSIHRKKQFIQKDYFNSKHQNNDTAYRPTVAKCTM